MKIQRTVQIHINTLNQEKMFNLLNEKHINITDLKRLDKFNTYFNIHPKDLKQTEELFTKNSIEIKDKKWLNLSKIQYFIKFRCFIFIAIILSSMLLCWLNLYIFNIKVEGINYLKYEDVVNYIHTNENISTFSLKNNVNASQLELNLMEKFPEISMVSIAIKGLTLMVNIKEKSESEILSYQTNDIVATFNGRITELIIISGDANVKVGDIVQNGDILVKSIIDEDKKIDANAKITAEVWLESSQTHYATSTKLVRTGKTISVRNVTLFNLPIYSSSRENTFIKFENEDSSYKLQNVILPLTIHQTIYYELKEETVVSDFNNEKDKIIDECRKNTLQQMQDNDIIKQENVIIDENSGITFVDYVMIVERNIF